MVAKRRLTNQTNVHTRYPYVKMSFKTQHGRIPIDPAILAAFGHRFKGGKEHFSNAVGDQKPETFLALNKV